jgi:hypothetical protein
MGSTSLLSGTSGSQLPSELQLAGGHTRHFSTSNPSKRARSDIRWRKKETKDLDKTIFMPKYQDRTEMIRIYKKLAEADKLDVVLNAVLNQFQYFDSILVSTALARLAHITHSRGGPAVQTAIEMMRPQTRECTIKLQTYFAQNHDDFPQWSLTSNVWALARLKAPNLEATLETVAPALLEVVGELEPKELANTVWAFSQSKHSATALFNAIADAALAKIGDCNDQDLCVLASSFARSGLRHHALFEGTPCPPTRDIQR